MTLFSGSGVALVTPMTQNGIDFDRLEFLINWHVTQGTKALILTGTTGEAATLSPSEKYSIYAFAVQKAKGQIQLIAGTGSNNTADSIALSLSAEAVGMDALLVVTPYYNKPSQEGLYAHYHAIAQAVKCPIILYNVPSRTGVDLLPETVLRLSALKNILGLKEAKSDLERIAYLAKILPESFKLYSGNDHEVVPFIEKGGHGVISVLGNLLPQVTLDLCEKAFSKNWDDAFALQAHYLPLIDALFCESNPAPVKTALSHMGMGEAHFRLPLVTLSPENNNRLIALLRTYKLIEGGAACH